VFANSRDVAAYFRKRHGDVIRAIRDLIAMKPELGLRNFAETPYVEPQNGQTYPSFDMDRKGFAVLSMGFTGETALDFKLAWFDAYEAMEAKLRQPVQSQQEFLNDPAAMRGLLLGYTEKVIDLEGQVSKLHPKADALDRIANSEGSLCITDAAKNLQVRPKDLFGYLRQHGWIYRRIGDVRRA
jgi:Rha family phage regulatory protein